MRKAVAVLDALSQGTRLDMMQILVSAGPEGLPAGVIADRLGRLPGSITFHFRHLISAGLISQRREGRQIIYRAEPTVIDDLINYLLENCIRWPA